MKDYNLGIIQPGESAVVNALGDYVRNTGTGSIKVVARNLDKPVKALSTVIGAGGWRSPESEYNHWVVTNNSAVAIAVSILIGKGEAGESAVQINADVNALTRFDNLSKDGNSWQIGASIISAPANYSHIALYNDPVSTVRCILKRFKVSGFGGDIAICHSTGLVGFSIGADFLYNKDLSITRSKFAGKVHSYNSLNASKIGDIIGAIPTDLNGTPAAQDYKSEPVIVAPGDAFILRNETLNTGVTALFEWDEEVI